MRSWLLATAVALLSLPVVAGFAVDAPGPPMNVTVTTTEEGTVVSWNPPLHDGGYPVQSFTVYRFTGGPDPWEVIETVSNETTSYVASTTTEGLAALYAVTASNEQGESQQSMAVWTILWSCPPVVVTIDTDSPPFIFPGINRDCLGV